MPTIQLDRLDQLILNRLQSDFPLVPRPFAAIAQDLDLAEAEVLRRIKDLKVARVIRQISAIFDSRALGYQSSLVAFQINPERLDEAAGIVSAHPGVSHNYAREHRINLWFTITLPPGEDLRGTAEELGRRAGAEKILFLPTIRLFKIGVNFDLTGEADMTAETAPAADGVKAIQPAVLTPAETNAVRELQDDLPVESRPFARAAGRLGCREEELLDLGSSFIRRGVMRRFAAVIRHRKAGFAANAMGVWVVPEAEVDRVGTVMGSFAGVSHCYQRPSYPPEWPFNVFTMVHGRTLDDCREILGAISQRTGIHQYDLLLSTKEYKKVRVRYFM